MHIPLSDTQELTIMSFEDALEMKDKNATYDRNKWLYVPDGYGEYRYILGTIGKKPLITIGINPSTAEPDKLDNTLKSVSRIADGNGFDSFIMFNVYAQRATKPDDMDKEINRQLHNENMKAFEWILNRSGKDFAIWAAWGNIIEKRSYLKECVRDMVLIGNKYGAKWYKAGKVSAKGHPHHPLYLKSDTEIESFDVGTYLDK